MRALLHAFVLVAALGLCWSCGPRQTVADLVAQFPDARKQPEGALDVADVTIDGITKRSIVAKGPTRLTTHATVPKGAVLKASLAMHPDVWEGPSDGVLMFIGISDGQSFETRASATLRPSSRAEDRRWHDVSINLDEFAGLTISIVLNTRAGESADANSDHDVAVWGAPVIVAR